jgi:hypothetical protein
MSGAGTVQSAEETTAMKQAKIPVSLTLAIALDSIGALYLKLKNDPSLRERSRP